MIRNSDHPALDCNNAITAGDSRTMRREIIAAAADGLGTGCVERSHTGA
jgi:hypothetical protein